MLRRRPQRQGGFNLIELMIGIAIFGSLLALAIPEFTTFLRNTKVRNAAENILTGMQLARAEAVRRNSTVRFQFVSDLTDACTLSGGIITSPSWVVSLDDPTSACASAPSEATAPRIVQKWNAAEGATGSGITWNIVQSGAGTQAFVFNGLGRLQGAGGIPTGVVQFDIEVSPTMNVSCEPLGNVRCLRIKLTTAGSVRMCDPNMGIATDPRFCT